MNTPHPDSLACPRCWATSTITHTQPSPAVTTAYLTCEQGHPWEMRWIPEVSV